jgi:hypothetical protein
MHVADRLIAARLEHEPSRIYATVQTSNKVVLHLLDKHGFERAGVDWNGRRDKLRLFIRRG